MRRPAALLVLGALVQVDGACLSGSGSVAGSGCSALSTCTDEAPNNKGLCKTKVIEEYTCGDFRTSFGTSCDACTCQSGCEGDGGDGTPLNWRPGAANPYGVSAGANGRVELTQAQQDDLVKQHNFVRAYHGACPLQWDTHIAQNVADVAPSGWSNCEAVNSDSSTRTANKTGNWNTLGENLVVQSSVYYANNFPVRQKTMSWYLQSANYDYVAGSTTAGISSSTTDFTQVVWKDTTHVGCQMYQCDYSGGKRVLLVCQYGPAGNVAGQFTAKVGNVSTTASGCGTCSNLPSLAPTTGAPTNAPITSVPSLSPSNTNDTSPPSKAPSKGPSKAPSRSPSKAPSGSPDTRTPSLSPSSVNETSPPSATPSTAPPTSHPSTLAPTHSPSKTPSLSPSKVNDTSPPSASPATSNPTNGPATSTPTNGPITSSPTLGPSITNATSPPSTSPTFKPVTVATVQAELQSLIAASTQVLSGSGSPHTIIGAQTVLNTTTQLVVVTATFSGSILQFDATARNNARNLLSAELGVDASRITIISVAAGSVIITFHIDNGVVIVPVVPSTGGVKAMAIVVPCIIGAVILIVTIVLLVLKGCPESASEDPIEDPEKDRDIEDQEPEEKGGEGEGEPNAPFASQQTPNVTAADMDEEGVEGAKETD